MVLCEPQVCEGFWQQLQLVLQPIAPRLTIAESVPTLDLMIALVAAGYGLGFSSLARISELHNPDIATRPLAGQSTLTTYLVRRNSEPSAPLDRFIDRVARVACGMDDHSGHQPTGLRSLDA